MSKDPERTARHPRCEAGARGRSSRPTWAATVLLALALSLLGAACGAAKTGAAAPSSEPPATVEDALARLDQAQGEIDRLLAPTAGAGDAYQQQQQPTYAQPPAAPPPAPGAAGPLPADAPAPAPPSRDAEGAVPTELSADPCATACRALASMGRAAEHLCGLAAPGDPRCDVARSRVQAAGERVRARCPACS